MEFLQRIGWFGSRVIIGMEVLDEGKYYRWIRALRKDGELLVQELKEGNLDVLASYLRKWPVARLLLFCPDRERIEVLVDVSAGVDPLSAALGVQVENPKSFIYQQVSTQERSQWITVFRKTSVVEHLNACPGRERIWGIELSPVGVAFLIPTTSHYQESVTYVWQEQGYPEYTWRGGLSRLSSNENLPQPIGMEDVAEGLNMDRQWVPLYGAILRQELFNGGGLHQFEEQVAQTVQVNTHLKWIEKLWRGVAGLGIAILMLSSMYVWEQYELSQYETTIAEHQEWLDRIEANGQRIQRFQELARQAGPGGLAPSQVSFYLDRMAALIPDEVQLDAWIYHPDEKDLERLPYEWRDMPGDMLISGKTSAARAIPVLIQELEKKTFVEGVTLVDGGYDQRTDQNRFFMLLKLIPYAQ